MLILKLNPLKVFPTSAGLLLILILSKSFQNCNQSKPKFNRILKTSVESLKTNQLKTKPTFFYQFL